MTTKFLPYTWALLAVVVIRTRLACGAPEATCRLVVIWIVGVWDTTLGLAPALVLIAALGLTPALVLALLTFRPSTFIRHAARARTRTLLVAALTFTPAIVLAAFLAAALLTAFLAAAWVRFATWALAALSLCVSVFHDRSLTYDHIAGESRHGQVHPPITR